MDMTYEEALDAIKMDNRLVYLAGAIDQVSPEDASNWRERATVIFHRHGYATFSPAHAYSNTQRILHATAVDAINKEAVRNCTAVFANMSFPSLGTVREIEYASQHRIPTYLYASKDYNRRILERSYATADCHILGEDLLGDSIQEFVNRHKGRIPYIGEPETEENEK